MEYRNEAKRRLERHAKDGTLEVYDDRDSMARRLVPDLGGSSFLEPKQWRPAITEEHA